MYPSPTRPALVSGILHAAAIALLLLLTRSKTATNPIAHTKLFVPRDASRYIVHARSSRDGGGGGGRDDTSAGRGVLPKTAPRVFVPPMAVIRNDQPILTIEPALLSPVEMRMPVAQIGLPDGAIGPPSNGRGSGGGIGDGEGGGIGDRHGPGYGDQDGGGVTGGPVRFAGSASAPVLLWKTEPEYTEEARKARLQGLVVLRIEVDPRGQANNITIRQSLGLGLDDRAVDAVRRWKFKPGYLSGKPVTTVAIVEVSFHLL